MSDSEVLRILRNKNIVVTKCSEPPVKFDLHGLETIGDLDEPVDVQGTNL